MKIYFSGAIYQKDKFGKAYEEIVRALENLGHTVFQDTTTVGLAEAINKSDEERVKYYKQVLRWIADADLVVLEVSFPSTLHIGHEVSLSLEKGKPVIGLYQRGYEPSFFLGKEDEKLFWEEYEVGQIKDRLKTLLEIATDTMDVRFNFFISPRHVAYLDHVVKTRRIPRSVYLRELIERDRNQNDEYHG